MYVVGTQKNCLNGMVLLSIKNIWLKLWISKNLQFYPEKFCLSKPMHELEDLKVLMHSPDLLNNVKIGQG